MSTQAQGAVGAETKTAGAMISLPLDDPKRPLNDSGLPSAMIWAGGEAYDNLLADQTLDLDSCSLAVGIYRAMTEAHAREIATLTLPAGLKFDPSPATPPGVPDSVRALLVERDELWRENLALRGTNPAAAANAVCDSYARENQRLFDRAAEMQAERDAILSTHPAGQSTGQGAEPNVSGSVEIIERCVKLAQDAGLDSVTINGSLFHWRNILAKLNEPALDSTRTGDEGTEAIDRGIVSALYGIDFEEEAESYEFCPDEGSHTPTEFEKALLIDFAHGLMNTVHAAVRPLVLAARPAAPEAQGAERVRHVKRGTEYEVLHRGALLQVSTAYLGQGFALGENASLVIYRGEDGKVWAREEEEFDDGRFEPAPPSSGQGGR